MAKIKFERTNELQPNYKSAEDYILDKQASSAVKCDKQLAENSLEGIVSPDLLSKSVIAMRRVQNDAIALYAKKNDDYGNAFNKGCDSLGYMYAFSRIWDKTQRFQNIVRKIAIDDYDIRVKDEKLEDTIADLANYCHMFLAWYNNVSQNSDKL